MKSIVFLALILAVCYTTPIFISDSNVSITPQEVEKYVDAFLSGMGIHEATNSSAACQAEIDQIFAVAAISIQQYENKLYYIGTLNMTTALGMFSPMSRLCADTGDELINLFANYVGRFSSWNTFVGAVGFNFVQKLPAIKIDALKIASAYVLNKNITQVAELSGALVKTVLDVNGDLTYTETNPFAPNPMVNWLWYTFESTYHFLTRTQTVSDESLALCEASAANLILDFEAGLAYQKNKDYKNAFFAYSDALSYLHGTIQGGHDSWEEFSNTWGMINQQVFKEGKFFKNIFGNIFPLVFNDGSFMAAEIFYGDIINISGAAGQIFYRILVKGLVAPSE